MTWILSSKGKPGGIYIVRTLFEGGNFFTLLFKSTYYPEGEQGFPRPPAECSYYNPGRGKISHPMVYSFGKYSASIK